ncbi:amino acid ABC transporter permease [Rhodobacter sp. KR11]|uniref:amino acid ABC transporter permease n=1 Tax=Rhodobacter sp. KR11 TaxID=2974588 RepID=UPI0022225928|nr:amino acid ABC transporter permease [Rhodobacter sp. KR11]MCW1920445.1 amino acid ABC transporter permease [Rhodobacter sp. KR11]
MIAFVRKEMLEASPPPASQHGWQGWMRENLFSSPLNIALTFVTWIALGAFTNMAVTWLLHGVWTADSYLECQEIILAYYGPEASGPCWAVIRERWHQFIFGFYPVEEWWRPVFCFGLMMLAFVAPLFSDDVRNARRVIVPVGVLTLVLMVLASAPVAACVIGAVIFVGALAISAKPLRLLPWTGVYPFVAVWLLWGGSLAGPVMALLGLVILGMVVRLLSGRLGVPLSAGLGIVAAFVWWTMLEPQIAASLPGDLAFLAQVGSENIGGFLLAFVIGVSAISMALPLGILLALGRRSDLFIVNKLSVGFIEFVRGVPLITLLFTASLLLQYFLPPQVQFETVLRVIILVTFFSAAYIAEVIRGGLAGLPKGQQEAADALGLDYWQAQRLIILPQALKISIPGIVNVFIGLFKDTTLVSFVGLMDPLRGVTAIVRADIDWKGAYWEPYLFVAAIFFVACFGMSRYALYLEARLKTDHR